MINITKNNLTDLYEAFIGPTKASYYVPIFQRFDSGGSATSWNWPAALITSWWMLYRGMFVAAFLWYPLLYVIASLLIAVPLSIAAGDADGALSQFVTLLASIIVMGLFSNKLFHRHVLKMIDKSGKLGLSDQQRREWLIRKGASNNLAVIVIIFVAIVIVGILAAVALPAYQDYTVRAKLSGPMAATSAVKARVEEFYAEHNTLPTSVIDIGYELDPIVDPGGLFSIAIQEDGEISANVSQITGGAEQYIVLTPTVSADRRLSWSCSSQGVPPKFLPGSCK